MLSGSLKIISTTTCHVHKGVRIDVDIYKGWAMAKAHMSGSPTAWGDSESAALAEIKRTINRRRRRQEEEMCDG